MARVRWITLFMMVLLVAACGGQPAATNGTEGVAQTASQSQDTGQPTPDPRTPNFVLVTRESAERTPDALEDLPGYGTLEASVTEDPNVGMLIDSLQLTRTGGETNPPPLEIVLLQNGSLSCNGAVSTVNQQQVAQITSLIDQVNFFGVQAFFISLADEQNTFKYRLLVRRGGSERMIDSEDGYMPTEYTILIGEIIRLCQV
jgi:hypothetical protein